MIDSFTQELIKLYLLPFNEVHIEWMLRARGFNLRYGTLNLINVNYGYNIAQQPLDAVLYSLFSLKRSFRVFIADILLIFETSAQSLAQLPIYYEPLNDEQIQHLFSDGLCSVFFNLLQKQLTPASDFQLHDHFLPDHFPHQRLFPFVTWYTFPNVLTITLS
jgi:hypothetical protein